MKSLAEVPWNPKSILTFLITVVWEYENFNYKRKRTNYYND